MLLTTNKFSNSYSMNFNAGVTSPRQTTTTQFGHGMGHNIVVPEEENIDIEYSIEEKIEENINKLEPKRTQSPVRPKPMPKDDPLKVNTMISEQPTDGYVLNMADSDSEEKQ